MARTSQQRKTTATVAPPNKKKKNLFKRAAKASKTVTTTAATTRRGSIGVFAYKQQPTSVGPDTKGHIIAIVMFARRDDRDKFVADQYNEKNTKFEGSSSLSGCRSRNDHLLSAMPSTLFQERKPSDDKYRVKKEHRLAAGNSAFARQEGLNYGLEAIVLTPEQFEIFISNGQAYADKIGAELKFHPDAAALRTKEAFAPFTKTVEACLLVSDTGKELAMLVNGDTVYLRNVFKEDYGAAFNEATRGAEARNLYMGFDKDLNGWLLPPTCADAVFSRLKKVGLIDDDELERENIDGDDDGDDGDDDENKNENDNDGGGDDNDDGA